MQMKAILKRVVGSLLNGARATLPAPVLVNVARAFVALGWRGSGRRFLDAYLARMPDDDAWQLRHANSLRDLGFYTEALEGFRRLQVKTPTNPDFWVGLGKLHLARGEVHEAVDALKAAHQFGDRADSVQWLNRWGYSPSAAIIHNQRSQLATWFFDITDVLLYLDTNSTVSGIQRVVINVSEVIDASPSAFNGQRVFCWLDPSSMCFREIPIGAFRHLLSLLERDAPGRFALAAAVSQCRSGPRIDPASGDTLVVLGAFWISNLYFEIVLMLRGRGVRFALYLYDLLPVTNPEFFEAELTQKFSQSLSDLLLLSDFALTISDYTRQKVIEFANDRLERDVPVTAIPLAHRMKSLDGSLSARSDVESICKSRFVLCVGTIEVRKNHRYLLSIWRDLLKERGSDAVPDLVIVGRWGWRVEQLQRELQESSYLGGKILILNGIGDADLSRLYQKAMFTVFPSMAEGWGLPIGESLAHGTPCIASGTTAMPEVGGEFAIYIDPHDAGTGKRAIMQVLDDPLFLAAASNRIRAGFVVRSWVEVSDHFEQALRDFKCAGIVHDTYARIEPGRVYRSLAMSGPPNPDHLKDQKALRLCLVAGWESEEIDVVWASCRTPVIRFQLAGVETCRNVRLALCLELPASQGPVDVVVVSGGLNSRLRVSGDQSRWYFVSAVAEKTGKVEVGLSIEGPVLQPDLCRSKFLRVRGLCVVGADDVEQRLAMLEELWFDGLDHQCG